MNLSQIFKFDETWDFPFYNGNPHLKKYQWLILLICILISFIAYEKFNGISEILGAVVFCLVLLIPLLYFSNWDYKLFFRKPTKNELIFAVLLFIGYIIYSFAVGGILDMYGLSGTGRTDLTINLTTTIGLIFAMMGEELVKFIPLMLFMRIFYKITDKKNLSYTLSAIIIMIGFAFLHFVPGTTIVSILLLQGLGSFFELYGYFKTKNILVPYICHLLTDGSLYLVILLGLV